MPHPPVVPPVAENPFRRVLVYFAPTGAGTRITWELSSRFVDPWPHSYQLQFAPTTSPASDAWIDVGLPAEDATELIDDQQRLYGKTLEAFYRVVLTTPVGVYISAPAGGLSAQDYRDWRISRKILRQEYKHHRYTATEGALVRERRYGPKCPVCVDVLTGQSENPNCTSCYGVGIDKGYHPAIGGVFAVLELATEAEVQDNDRRGTAKDESAVPARFSGVAQMNSRDLFVEARSGRRWIVLTVKEEAAVRSRVLVHNAELRLLPFSSPLYGVPA